MVWDFFNLEDRKSWMDGMGGYKFFSLEDIKTFRMDGCGIFSLVWFLLLKIWCGAVYFLMAQSLFCWGMFVRCLLSILMVTPFGDVASEILPLRNGLFSWHKKWRECLQKPPPKVWQNQPPRKSCPRPNRGSWIVFQASIFGCDWFLGGFEKLLPSF